jgi:hypothetical protein
MIGVFCFEATWKGWTAQQRADELLGLKELGVTTIVTETIEPPTDLIQAASEAGLDTFVSVACFSDHAWPHLTEGLELRPVQADGRPRPKLEWYTGLIPTHEGYGRAQLGRIARVAEARPAGIILDFIRWPLHWELELRAGAPEPEESSFDALTIDAFGRYLRDLFPDEVGPLDPSAMTGPLRDRWTDFKCEVITRFACAAASAVRAVDAGIRVGAFIVPGTEDQRRRLLGQDVAALGVCLDLLLPMTYHGILHEPVELVTRVTRDVADRTPTPVIPVLQVTAEPSVAGPWDWGRPVSPGDLGRAIASALRVAPGAVLFPLEGLDAPRKEALAAASAASPAPTPSPPAGSSDAPRRPSGSA